LRRLKVLETKADLIYGILDTESQAKKAYLGILDKIRSRITRRGLEPLISGEPPGSLLLGGTA
jgi:hypothetical protein